MKESEIKRVFASLIPKETIVNIKTVNRSSWFLLFIAEDKKTGEFLFFNGRDLEIRWLSDGRHSIGGTPLPKTGWDVVEVKKMDLEEFIYKLNNFRSKFKSFLKKEKFWEFLQD